MKMRFWVVGLLFGVVIALAGCSGSYVYQGSLIDPPAPAADFALTDQHGQPFRLSDQQGKVVLIAFGYTNCPDVCPLTLANFKEIKAELKDQVGEVQFAFVTIDPERDTQERLQAYIGSFDPEFIGLSGDMSDLESVWKSYGVYRSKRDTGSASGYAMDHTSRLYTIDKSGNLRLTFPFDMDQMAVASDLRHLAQE